MPNTYRTHATGPWLNRHQVAEILGVAERTIDRWADEGYLVPHRIGGRRNPRYTQAEVDRVVAAQDERRQLRDELVDDENWLTKTEVAAYFGVSVHTITAWQQQRILAKHYGDWAYGVYIPSYFRRSELDAVLVREATPGTPAWE